MAFELFQVCQKLTAFSNMQHRQENKSRNTQYASVKDYTSTKEQPKKHQKSTQAKSNIKHKLPKSNNNSLTKLKPTQKTARNNENFNSINVAPENPHKNRSGMHQAEHLKKQTRKENKSTRNSSERLYKSKSAVRLQPKSSRVSPCPVSHKDQPEEKATTQRNLISRADKEKKVIHKPKEERIGMKKSGSMITIAAKRQHTEREKVHNNRVSIKTEGSSKVNSVIREDEKMKKNKKKSKLITGKKQTNPQKKVIKNLPIVRKEKKNKLHEKIQKSLLYSDVSFQQFCQEQPCESQLISSDKLFLMAPRTKIKTEGYQPSLEEHNLHERSFRSKTEAATTIQKVFRGYITRKYIEEAKFIINNVKKIQIWWRSILLERKNKKAKPLSISNSLITIKDFNESMKTEKIKTFSESKESTLSNHKLSIKDILKNVLEEKSDNEQDEKSIVIEKVPSSLLQLQSPNSKPLTKQVYIEDKIKGQIISEKNFNSPKCMNSPNIAKTPTTNFAIKEFFNNSSEKQKIKEILHSPRIKSPQALKVPPSSQAKEQEFQLYQENSDKITPFEAGFGTIEEFSLLLVNFFRDCPHHMKDFLARTMQMKYHRTQLTLQYWNSFKLVEEPFDQDDTFPLDYEIMEQFDRPSLFSPTLRNQILAFPEIEIELNSKHFDLQSQKNKIIHRSFLEFVFDAIEEAFYQPYKYSVFEWTRQLSLIQFRGERRYFENIFSNALEYIFKQSQILAGIMLENEEEQQQQRQLQQKMMDKRIDVWDLGLTSRLGIKVEIAEWFFEELAEELAQELLLLM